MSDTVLGPGSFFLSRKTCAFLAYPVSGSPAPLSPTSAFESLKREGREGVLPVEPLQNPPHFSSVAQSCPTLCNPMDCSTPGFPVHYQLLELAQTHVHPVSDATQPSHPLSSPSPPAFWGMVLLPLFSTLKATRGQRNPILPWIRAQPEQPPSLKRSPFSRSQCVEDHFANWLTQQITNLLNHG